MWQRVLVLILSILIGSAGSLMAQTDFTVVLDAGHGGKDPGTTQGSLKEKNITLDITRRLGRLISQEHPKVRVLYTRSKDVFVGLQARADFANRHKASLFMSIHVNSTPRGSSARGTETYVLGLGKQERNLSVAMRENEAILLEDDYKTTYKGFDPKSVESYIMFDLMQEAYLERSIDMASYIEREYRRIGRSSRGVKQDGFWVLSQSAMPSILTEVGFIGTEGDYLGSEEGRQELAQALAKAFTRFYKGSASQGREVAHEDLPETAEEAETEAPPTARASQESGQERQATSSERSKTGSIYRVQFMSSPESLSTTSKSFARLKRKVHRAKEGRYYIYSVGQTRSLEEARKVRQQVRKIYKDCFIVEYRAGKRVGRVQ